MPVGPDKPGQAPDPSRKGSHAGLKGQAHEHGPLFFLNLMSSALIVFFYKNRQHII